MWKRDEPKSLGPSAKRNVVLVEISNLSRLPAIALPRTSSDRPFEYTSAVSNRFTPASRQIPTMRCAAATSPVAPHASKNSFPPPNVPAPKLRTGILRPEPPRSRYSMAARMLDASAGCKHSPALSLDSRARSRFRPGDPAPSSLPPSVGRCFPVEHPMIDVGPEFLGNIRCRIDRNIQTPLRSCIGHAALARWIVEVRQAGRRTRTHHFAEIEGCVR